MSVQRLSNIPGFGIDRVAAAAGEDPDVLRLENLDTDLPPPAAAIEATRAALCTDSANSYLPFTGALPLRAAVARRLTNQTGNEYSPEQIVITCGGTEGLFDALLATTDPGDEVILSDPTYAGMINRVRLAGAVPKLVPLVSTNREWRLDLSTVRAVATPRTRAIFLMNPSMPSGAVLSGEEWEAIAGLCVAHSLWLLYNAAMERILFDGRRFVHPASLPGMAERTLIIGSVSKEFRMIGWRIGWVAGPLDVIADVARAHIYNAVAPSGIMQAGALAALATPLEDFLACLTEWQRRRDVVLEQLRGFSAVSPAGGWSLLVNVHVLGHDSVSASGRLLERGKVAATPMRGWGDRNGDDFVRIVFSNEPAPRLATLRERFERAFSS